MVLMAPIKLHGCKGCAYWSWMSVQVHALVTGGFNGLHSPEGCNGLISDGCNGVDKVDGFHGLHYSDGCKRLISDSCNGLDELDG
jgi:hypothetical protein